MIADWHPNLKRLVHFTDPSAITPVTIRSSVPIAHWGTKNITLIGDAIHSMTPFRGIGANTALKDAALLCRNLIAAHRGEKSLLQAVHDYEVEMIRYGFEAVKNSLRAMNQAVSDNAFALGTVKTLFRIVNALPPLKRRMFKDQGNK
ncbi:MAG: FAD-dependent monooxygenase [Planifilum fulgidum]